MNDDPVIRALDVMEQTLVTERRWVNHLPELSYGQQCLVTAIPTWITTTWRDVVRILQQLAPGSDLGSWNDAPGRTLEDVENLLAQAKDVRRKELVA